MIITQIQYEAIISKISDLKEDIELYQAEIEKAGTIDLRENEGYHAAKENKDNANRLLEKLIDIKSKAEVIPISTSEVFDLGSLILVQKSKEGEPNLIKDLQLDKSFVNNSVKAIDNYSGSISKLWKLFEYNDDLFNYPEIYFNDKSFSTRMFLIDDYDTIMDGIMNTDSPLIQVILGKEENEEGYLVPRPDGTTHRVYVRKLSNAFLERFKKEYPRE